jgi:hypothetical protein
MLVLKRTAMNANRRFAAGLLASALHGSTICVSAVSQNADAPVKLEKVSGVFILKLPCRKVGVNKNTVGDASLEVQGTPLQTVFLWRLR